MEIIPYKPIWTTGPQLLIEEEELQNVENMPGYYPVDVFFYNGFLFFFLFSGWGGIAVEGVFKI